MLSEHSDRFEGMIEYSGGEILLSIDKPISPETRDELESNVRENVDVIYSKAIDFFNQVKDERGIGYIDDLSDPQVMASKYHLSVYWSSALGEIRGESTIGVDLKVSTLEPIDLTIGD